MFFPYIFTVLTFSTASPSIYGNIHWTLKTSPNNITNHPYFFSDFSPIFFVIFTFSTALPSTYGNVQWTLKTAPYPIFFSIFSAILFICKCNFFYGNVHRTLKWWDCREGMKLLLKWKMKCFMAGIKENERNFILLLLRLRMKQVPWMNENSFHSFTVADQVFLWHVPVVHDVNGSYQSCSSNLAHFTQCRIHGCILSQNHDGMRRWYHAAFFPSILFLCFCCFSI